MIDNNQRNNETPFEYLKNRKGEPFAESIVKNWYKARAYVLNKLKDITIGPHSVNTLKIVVDIDDDKELMLSVVRHLALAAHFANYEECDELGMITCKNCTTIYIVSATDNIEEELKKEEYLNNLLKYCQYTKNGKIENDATQNKMIIPIDIDFHISNCISDKDREGAIVMTPNDVTERLHTMTEDEVYSIDTRMAVLCGKTYALGADINNLPYEDIHDLSRYHYAFNAFQHSSLQDTIGLLITTKWQNNQATVKKGLSNIFCADRFLSIAAGMKECSIPEKEDESTQWKEYGLKLAVSEHSRWIVEKLILGFRPLSKKEHHRHECLLGNQREAYKKLLKENIKKILETFHDDYTDETAIDEKGGFYTDPAHINLCSFKELRRIDPDNRKHDSFLMLAIPKILDKIKKDNRQDSN